MKKPFTIEVNNNTFFLTNEGEIFAQVPIPTIEELQKTMAKEKPLKFNKIDKSLNLNDEHIIEIAACLLTHLM